MNLDQASLCSLLVGHFLLLFLNLFATSKQQKTRVWIKSCCLFPENSNLQVLQKTEVLRKLTRLCSCYGFLATFLTKIVGSDDSRWNFYLCERSAFRSNHLCVFLFFFFFFFFLTYAYSRNPSKRKLCCFSTLKSRYLESIAFKDH